MAEPSSIAQAYQWGARSRQATIVAHLRVLAETAASAAKSETDTIAAITMRACANAIERADYPAQSIT